MTLPAAAVVALCSLGFAVLCAVVGWLVRHERRFTQIEIRQDRQHEMLESIKGLAVGVANLTTSLASLETKVDERSKSTDAAVVRTASEISEIRTLLIDRLTP